MHQTLTTNLKTRFKPWCTGLHVHSLLNASQSTNEISSGEILTTGPHLFMNVKDTLMPSMPDILPHMSEFGSEGTENMS